MWASFVNKILTHVIGIKLYLEKRKQETDEGVYLQPILSTKKNFRKKESEFSTEVEKGLEFLDPDNVSCVCLFNTYHSFLNFCQRFAFSLYL